MPGDLPSPGFRAAGPLAGTKVLDLSRVLAGPYCTALLADLGAEVIKLEPTSGDDYRHVGPFKDGESALFTLNNRGKRSLALDLKNPSDLDLALRLAARVDVVVENFRPGVAARLGLGADVLRGANPALIYCSISGFGQDGPFRDLPAYDLVVQAMSGLMAATGEEGGAPLKSGESLADLVAGLFASWSITAALVQRDRTGQGATLDVAMFDALFSMLTTSHALHLHAGMLPERVGNRHPLSTPFGCFPTSDGQVVIAVLNGRQFGRLAALIGAPEAEGDPRFATDESRTTHEPILREIISAWSTARTTDEAVGLLSAEGLPAAPIWTIAEAAASEHAVARGLVTNLSHPTLGHVPVVGQPVRFDGIKPIATTAAPSLGGDIDAILAEFGLERT